MRNALERLLRFLDGLDEAHLAYDLKHVRETLLVVVCVPAGYCEIEFFADGTIESEWFRRGAGVEVVDDAWLSVFIADYAG